MVCNMMKKAVVGAALGAGTLALVFGTSAPSYVRTAFHKVRTNAKSSVPVQFEIDRARQEVADLEPAIRKNIEAVAEAEVEVEDIGREIVATRGNLAKEARAIVALRDMLKSDVVRTGGVTYSTDEIKADLTHRKNHYDAAETILNEREATLKIRQKNLAAAREQLDAMKAAKKTLAIKIEGIEARLRQIEATRAAGEFSVDDSALSRARKTVDELDHRLEVLARVTDAQGKLSEKSIPVVVDPARDILKEVDAKFGESPKPAGDKSL